MVLRFETETDKLTVHLSGELDHHAARGLREQIDAAVERGKSARLCLDFKDITFMDSSGIGLIMGRYRLMQGRKGTLEITGAAPHLDKVMRLAGLEKLGILQPQSAERMSST